MVHVPSLSPLVGDLPPDLAAAHATAISRLGAMALEAGFYVRPLSKPGLGGPEMGSTWVKPLAERLVAVDDDMAAHIRAAMPLPFPQPEFDIAPARDLEAAVRACVEHGNGLAAWRRARAVEVRAIADSLAELNAYIIARVAGPHRHLVVQMNLAFMDAFAVAVKWPDTGIVAGFFRGFKVVGDIPDSGLFRPLERPATVDPAEYTPASNDFWTGSLAASLRRQATEGTAEQRRMMCEVEAATRKQARAGHAKGPFSRHAIVALFSAALVRPMRRFGVEQGEGDGRKVRPIDNARDVWNPATSTHETLVCISIFFVALVARVFAAQCAAAGVPMVALLFGLDDMRAAYNRVPVDAAWANVFAIYSFVKRDVVYYYTPGHCFGMASSVLNFNRFPFLMCAMARVLYAVPVASFFDDYLIVDAAAGGASGQECLAGCHELVGQAVEPKKRKPMATANVGLGTHADVSRAHTAHEVEYTPTARRLATILAMLGAAKASGRLPPGEAATIRGKLGFILTAAYARIGRAALQPLVQREFRDISYEWTPSLEAMLEFFTVLFSPGRLPPLVASLFRYSLAPIVVYSDAMFELTPDGLPFAQLGFVVLAGGRRLVGRYVIPPAAYQFFSPDRRTYILQAEILAAIAVYWSLPAIFSGAAAIHFEDNTGALSHLVHGYASAADCARLVNTFHLLVSALRCDVWFEWVPSKANCADLPSRGQMGELRAVLADAFGDDGEYEEVAFVIPAFDTLAAPLAQLDALIAQLAAGM